MSAAERKQKQREEAPRKAEIAELEAQQKREASMDANGIPIPMFVKDAPHGKGKITTGGPQKMEQIQAAKDRLKLWGGKKVKPLGTSCKEGDADDIYRTKSDGEQQTFSNGRLRVRLGKTDDEQERARVFEDMLDNGCCVVCNVECRGGPDHGRSFVESETTLYVKAQEHRSLLEQINADPSIIGLEPKIGPHAVLFNRLFRTERRRHNAVMKTANETGTKARDQRDIDAAKNRSTALAEVRKLDEDAQKRKRDEKNKKAREARATKKAK